MFVKSEKTKKKRGRPRKTASWTGKLLNDRAREYFIKCDARTKDVVTADGVVTVDAPAPYVIQGLCNYLDINVMTFRNWRLGKGCSADLHAKAIYLHQKITDNRISGALDGVQNSSFAKFLLTNDNSEEYREKVEVENGVTKEVKSLFELCSGLKIGDRDDQ